MSGIPGMPRRQAKVSKPTPKPPSLTADEGLEVIATCIALRVNAGRMDEAKMLLHILCQQGLEVAVRAVSI